MFLAVVTVCELLLWLPPAWHWRKPLAAFLLAALAAGTLALAALGPRLWLVLLILLNLYRMVNLFRLIKDRMQADYLYHAARRTSLWLVGLQLTTLALALLVGHYEHSQLAWLYVAAAGQLVAGLVLLASTVRHLRTTKPPKLTVHYADNDLPSLTVAIPARNETEDLEQCLQTLTSSGYPKLEIIVLDDCSQTRRTPDIIRGFAHDGVRFIAGKAPPSHWLAKNYAYAQLAAEANGELVLFCGVDVRFGPESLELLVKSLLQKKKGMISLLPRNVLPGRRSLTRLLVQPNRYVWELALPRRLISRPPVLSTCWLITRQALREFGGFAAVNRKIIPASYFARRTAAASDGYGFLCSDDKLGVTSHKNFDEQLATAVRTRYPQLHRRPEMVALVSLAELGVLLWPLVISLAALTAGNWTLAIIAGAAYLLEAATYGKLVNLTYRKVIFRGAWLLPVAVVQDVAILNYSMWQYEFNEVIWKGRNVCIPVMQAPAQPAADQALDLARKG